MKKLSWLLLSALVLTGCGSPEQKIEEYVANARLHLSNGDFQAAHIEFRNAMKINPNHVEALYLVTKVFEHKQEYAKSYRYLKRVLELDPTHVDALLALGTIELASKQLDKALERAEAASKISPDAAKVKAYNAVVRLKLGDYEFAVKEAKEVLAIDPNNLEATVVLGSERLTHGDAAGAVAVLNNYQGELNLPLELLKVQAYNYMKDLNGAVNVFQNLIASENKDEYYYALAKQYLAFGKENEANEVFKLLLKGQPQNLDAKLSYIGFLNQYMGEGRAIANLKSFIAEDPKNLKLNFALVDAYITNGLFDEAKQVLTSITQFDELDSRVKAYTRLAKLEYGTSNFDIGDKYLNEALSLDPSSQEAKITRAQRTLQKGETDKAIAELRTVLTDAPDSAVVLGLLGKAHEIQGKTELALDQYTKAYQAEPGNKIVLLQFVQLLKRQGQYDQIEKVLDRSLRFFPRDVEVLERAAENKLALQNWSDAQKIAERLDSLNTNASVVEQIRGAALFGMDEKEQATEAFERAYDLSEDNSQVMATLVRSYLVSDQKEKAFSFLNSVLENDPDNMVALHLLAQLHSVESDTQAAESLYRDALRYHPASPVAYQQLSSFLMRQQRFDEVVQLLSLDDDDLSTNTALLLIKAGAYEESEDFGSAIETYKQVLEIQPELDVAANNLAVLLSDKEGFQDLEKAKEFALRFRKSNVPYFQDTLGWIYYQLGDYNNALYFHESAVQAIPEFAEFRYHLGMSYLKSGEADKAKAELMKSLELSENSEASWKESAKDAIRNL